MIEGIYFFGDQLRWNLGWPNPNPAGAFIALWIPLLAALHFAMASAKVLAWRTLAWLALPGEGALLFLLCKTYSRGALLALAVAFLFFHGLLYFAFRDSRHRRRAGIFFVIRAITLIVLLWVTGFIGRIDPGFVTSDDSIGNRSTLWKGGIQMIARRPFSGWGRRESGPQFMHWFQPIEETAAYAGMVNSYLHVGVEYGLRILLPCLFALLLPVALALVLARRPGCPHGDCPRDLHRVWAFGGGASMLAFLIANIFSTLWIFERLWLPLLPAALLIGLSWALVSAKGTRLRLFARAFGITLAGILFFAVVLIGFGHSLRAQSDLLIRLDGDWIRLSQPGDEETSGQKILVLVDSSVLGTDWGKEIRRLVLAPELASSLVFAKIGSPSEAKYRNFPQGAEDFTLIVAGPVDLTEAGFLQKAERILWLHPSGRPEDRAPQMPPIQGEIWLPLLDTRGQSSIWRNFAAEQGWEVYSSGAIGNDLRPHWPDIVFDAVFSPPKADDPELNTL